MSTIMAITYDSAIAVSPSATVNDPAGPFAGFFSGAGGTVSVVDSRGRTVAFTSLPAGVIVPMAIIRVLASPAPPAGMLGMLAMPFKGTPNPS
jgi:hypothetical protein